MEELDLITFLYTHYALEDVIYILKITAFKIQFVFMINRLIITQ